MRHHTPEFHSRAKNHRHKKNKSTRRRADAFKPKPRHLIRWELSIQEEEQDHD